MVELGTIIGVCIMLLGSFSIVNASNHAYNKFTSILVDCATFLGCSIIASTLMLVITFA